MILGRWLLAIFFVLAGLNHFRDPDFYLAMMPPFLPAHGALNLVSGACEIAGGLGVLVPRTRRFAGWGLLALLIAVFPANIHAALEGHLAVLWVRLPFQPLFMLWVWSVTLRARAQR